jgi:hypothetical protein
LKHATPKKKAGSVPVSRTIATAVIATAAAGVATPAVAAELPQPHHDIAEAPALPEALAETALPASIPPVQHVAPDYSLPGFSGQSDIGPGVRATTEAVKDSVESPTTGAPKTAGAVLDPTVQSVAAEAGGVSGDTTEATDIVDGDIVDGVAGQVDALPTGQAAGIGRSADLPGGLGGAVDTATALVR